MSALNALAAFTVGREHVCLDEEGEVVAPQIYGPEAMVENIESIVGSATSLGEPQVLGSLANVFNFFEGRITVIGPAFRMTADAVTEIARSYWHILRQLHCPSIQELCLAFRTLQVQRGLLFLFDEPSKTLETLWEERRLTVMKPDGKTERDRRVDQAYRMALYFRYKLEEYPNEQTLQFLHDQALEMMRAQIEQGVVYLFHNPRYQERSSLSLSSASSLSSSSGIASPNS